MATLGGYWVSLQMEVPITIVGGDSTTWWFCCKGYHPRDDEAAPLEHYELGLPQKWPCFSLRPSDHLEGSIAKQLTLTTTEVRRFKQP